MREITYRRGEVVVRQGDLSDCMFYVKWGCVGVFTDYGTPVERKITELGQGAYFGEMGVLEAAPRSATVTVLEHGTILRRIGEEDFAEFISEDPSKAFDLVQQLSHKLRQVTKDYLELCGRVDEILGDDATDGARPFVVSDDEASDGQIGVNHDV